MRNQFPNPLHIFLFTCIFRQVKELVLSPETPELKTRDRIVGMLTLVEEELQDVPLYYSMAQGYYDMFTFETKDET